MQDFQPIPGLTGLIFLDSNPNPTRRFHAHHPSSSSSSSSSPPIKCPRCDSTNTKFCYYNNYNLSQPRHFCKSCRRYWTKGGVLRNVPVGGGCRKNSSSSSSSSSSKRSRPKPDKNPNPASASASGSSSESSSNPLPNPNPDPILEHPVFSHADFGFGFSDTGLLTEEQKVEGIGDGLEWGAGGSDSGSLFDMTGSLNLAVYWNQSHWGDTDPSLDLP